ncbi:MAG: 2-dehydropantoate 2-reductase [Myxococcales bacterium]|nr:2-dehydropantoate 2-reductase [Myxococcales bacterium]MCB9521772.1 2-dehydropantoate 2-reductase [Myxococcales bacterium]
MAAKVLVVGCGGIGGAITAHLAQAGVDVVAVSRNGAVVDAVARRGLRLTGGFGERAVPARVVPEAPAGPFDWVLLTTQPTDVEAAAAAHAHRLSPTGRMVCFQNGLCEARVAEVLGDPAHVVGAVVSWGAHMPEPGQVDKTSRKGGFVLGRLDGQPDDPALDSLAGWLSAIGPVKRTANLPGVRWSKLALNCVVSSLGTLNGSTLGPVIRQGQARRLAFAIMGEAVAVAQAEGVALEKVAGTLDLPWMVRSAAPPGRALRHGVLAAAGLKYRRMKSSMLRAIEAGRPPAVDHLNGEVVRYGARHGAATPANAAVTRAVWALARGEARPGPAIIDQVWGEVRRGG